MSHPDRLEKGQNFDHFRTTEDISQFDTGASYNAVQLGVFAQKQNQRGLTIVL